jgi:acyl-CoA synthetase (NDP forming)
MILASPDPTPDKLGGFFAPRNVAVVGMSADDEKFGGVLRQRLLGSDLDRVIAITQRSKMVPGVTVSPSFADIDGPLDLTILSVPTKQVLANVGAAADIGCTNFVICSAGFAEDGDQGEALQRELVALAANRNLRILGPNCLGFVNRLDNVWAGVVRRPVQQSGRHGGIAFISQTGSLGVALFSSKIDEFAYFVSTGNEAGLTFGELARHFALQSNVRVVMGLIESIRDAEQLVAAAAICAQLSKTLVVLKSGRSKVGAESALLHTAAIAGDARVYDALFAENGIVQVRTVEELMGVAALADRFGSGRERRMFVVTTSGGSAVLAADYCEESAMELTQPNEDEQVALAQVLGTSSERVRNPLDVTGINAFRRGVLGNALRIIDASARYGWILVPMGGTLGGTAERRAGEIVESAAELKTAVAPVWQHELVDETGYHILQESASTRSDR